MHTNLTSLLIKLASYISLTHDAVLNNVMCVTMYVCQNTLKTELSKKKLHKNSQLISPISI